MARRAGVFGRSNCARIKNFESTMNPRGFSIPGVEFFLNLRNLRLNATMLFSLPYARFSWRPLLMPENSRRSLSSTAGDGESEIRTTATMGDCLWWSSAYQVKIGTYRRWGHKTSPTSDTATFGRGSTSVAFGSVRHMLWEVMWTPEGCYRSECTVSVVGVHIRVRFSTLGF